MSSKENWDERTQKILTKYIQDFYQFSLTDDLLFQASIRFYRQEHKLHGDFQALVEDEITNFKEYFTDKVKVPEEFINEYLEIRKQKIEKIDSPKREDLSS